MEAREARRLSSLLSFNAASPGAQATSHVSLDTLAAIAGTVLVRFDDGGGDRYRRVIFWPAAEGAPDQTWRVDLYAVLPADHVGGLRFDLQYLGQASGTVGADPFQGYSALVEEAWAKTAAFASSGFAEAQAGGALQVLPFPVGTGGAGNPAGFAIADVGPAVAILAVPAKGAASPVTSLRLLHQRWS